MRHIMQNIPAVLSSQEHLLELLNIKYKNWRPGMPSYYKTREERLQEFHGIERITRGPGATKRAVENAAYEHRKSNWVCSNASYLRFVIIMAYIPVFFWGLAPLFVENFVSSTTYFWQIEPQVLYDMIHTGSGYWVGMCIPWAFWFIIVHGISNSPSEQMYDSMRKAVLSPVGNHVYENYTEYNAIANSVAKRVATQIQENK